MPNVGTQADATMYARVFEGHAEGRIILEDLVRRFYDVPTFTAGGIEGARMSDFKAGRRAVVGFVLNQIGQINAPADDAAGDE